MIKIENDPRLKFALKCKNGEWCEMKCKWKMEYEPINDMDFLYDAPVRIPKKTVITIEMPTVEFDSATVVSAREVIWEEAMKENG